jgi:AAA+ superfamily predicted ATPase
VSESTSPPITTHADDLFDASPARSGSVLFALQRLDALLERAARAAGETYGPDALADPFRGLYLSQDQMERSLAGPPGRPLLKDGVEPVRPGWDEILATDPNWAWLNAAYGLSEFDLDVILIALAPEVDLRYERVYAYLQDDVSRRRPSVDLALNLLCSTAGEKLAQRAHLSADAVLVSQRLLALVPDAGSVQPPLPAHILVPDGQIVDILLRQGGLDRRLTAFCRLVAPPKGGAGRRSATDEALLAPATERALVAMAHEAWGHAPLRLYFQGARGAGKRRAAEALAARMGLRLLAASLTQLSTGDRPGAERTLPELLALIFREAWLQGAILYLDDLDTLQCEQGNLCRRYLSEELARAGLAYQHGITIMAGALPWAALGREPLGVLVVPFPLPNFARRRQAWEDGLAAYGATLAADELDALAGRFRLGPGQIAEAIATADSGAHWRAAEGPAGDPAPAIDDIFAAARAQTGHDLLALARKIEPVYGWDDIVLPDDALAQLREICQRVAFRQRVLGEWGFERKLSLGKGISALFAGPPGTGKTMAAEVIARELGLDLYKIDLAAVISKYIGETEKNLERIFNAASDANAILFFDEADALFGKRSEVRDSHDRYANIEIAYLLQRMEQYDGLAILATNVRQHMDEAFTRRLQFVIEFPYPDQAYRRQIWQVCFPPEAPRDPALDFDHLARTFRLSGGNIKNIVLGAAYLAASDGAPIGMGHLIQATRREYQKMGKVLSEAD